MAAWSDGRLIWWPLDLMAAWSAAGVTGKMSTQTMGDDDNFGTELSQQAILRVLGSERRNRVLAGLYMGRSDTTLNVRQAALHVWKVVVAHTPKTLREILPTLFQLLLGCLASKSYDKRQVGDCVVNCCKSEQFVSCFPVVGVRLVNCHYCQFFHCSWCWPFLSTFLPLLPFSDLSSHNLSSGLPRFLQPPCYFVSDCFGNLSFLIQNMCRDHFK